VAVAVVVTPVLQESVATAGAAVTLIAVGAVMVTEVLVEQFFESVTVTE
jgi:hypothetical protein